MGVILASKRRTHEPIFGWCTTILFLIAISGTLNAPTVINKQPQAHANPSGMISTSNEFQGVGDPLQGVATATYPMTQTGVIATNTTTTNIPLFIDDAHGWKGTRVNVNVTNIKDTRDWVSGGSYDDAVLDSFPIYRKSENTWYPMNDSYLNGQTTYSELYQNEHVISNESYRAIRLHFAYINIRASDFILIYSMDDRILLQIAGINSSTNFWTPWFEYAQIKIGYYSNIGSTNGPNLYYIDYYEYVPIEETIVVSPRLETPHPYALSTNYTRVLNSSRSAPFMRAHFSLLNVETGGDIIDLKNNNSARFFRYDTNAMNPVYSTDFWSPWNSTNQITFVLSSDGDTNVYNGFIVDKYQLSSYGSGEFVAHAIRVSNRPIYWNHYLEKHVLGTDNRTVTAPAGSVYMRLNFTYSSFDEGDDYLVLYDNQSRWIIDYTGDMFNFVTPWFHTNSITLSYLSDSIYYTEGLNLGAKIRWVEWTNTTTLNFTSRMEDWTFNYDYDVVNNRASGFVSDRNSEIGLGLGIKGINKTIAGAYGYTSFSYESKDKAEFYQEFPIPRGGIANGYFKLDYFGQKLMASNDFELYAAINGSVIYSRPFATIAQKAGTWQSTGNIWMPIWSNQTNLFNSINAGSSIKFSVGMRFINPSPVTFSNFANIDRQVMLFDDVEFVLITVANSTQAGINLRVNGTALTDASIGGWGSSSLILDGDWLENPLNLTFTTASPSISFDVNLVLDVQASIMSTWAQVFANTGSSYVVQPGANITWSWYENVYIPSGYHAYVLNVSKPNSRIIDSVRDPTGTSTPFTNGAETSRWFSFTTSSPGWYSISAHSRNYLDPVSLSIDNATWGGSLSIVNQQSAYISAPFRNTLSPPSGNGTLLLKTPTGTQWVSQPYAATGTLNVTRGPFVFAPQNSTGGMYSGYIAWENGTEIGFRSFSIGSTHTSRLEISYPVDARIDNTTSQLVDSIVPIRIIYNDTFSNSLIGGASITGSLNSTPVTNFIFTESTPGIYDYALDTTGLPEGHYLLQVSTTEAGYSIATRNISIFINVDTRIDGFTSYQEVQHGFNASISFHYHDVIRDLGISGANILVSFTGAEHTIDDIGGGDYSISLNTTSFGLGSHVFTITVQKSFHETAVLSGSFNIIQMASRVEVFNGTLSGTLDTSIGPYLVSFYHPDFPTTLRFSNAAFTAYIDSNLTTKLDQSNYTITSLGAGQYRLSISTGLSTPLNTPGIKTVYIVVSNSSMSPFYIANDTASLSFILNARPVTYSLFQNSTNITSEASFSVGIQEDFILNVTVRDTLSGGLVTNYAFAYNFSNGHSGTFSSQGNDYVVLVNHTDLSGGYFTLRISGTSSTHEALQVQYVVSVQFITTYVEGFVNYQLREHGTNASIAFHYHDAVHDTGILGATVTVSFAGIGLLNPSSYIIVDSPDGNYTIALNTTLFGLGLHAFSINASKLYHGTQIMSGYLEVTNRLSTLLLLNSSVTGYLMDDLGPVSLMYYHPDYPATLNYTRANFTLSINPSFTQLVNPAGYNIVLLPSGAFALSLKTGPGTSFATDGIKTLYVRATNSSSSTVHVANATTTFSFILSLRAFGASIHSNGVNITSETTITANINQPLIMNITLADALNGSVPLLSLNYSISNGPSGSFVLTAGNYTANVMNGNFTTGVQTLSITSSSPIYALFSRVYLITIIPREFYLDVRVNGSLLSQNGLFSIISGAWMELEANYTDDITSNPLYGGRVNVTVDGMLFSSFIVNATSAKVVLSSFTILPGFHSVSVLATSSNYTAEYLAFTLEITRRVLHSDVSFNGMPWDGISPVEAQLASMIAMNFTMVDNATATPVPASNVTLSPPSIIGLYGTTTYLNNITLSFNSSGIGVGREYVTFIISSPRYTTLVLGIIIDVQPIPIHVAITNNQTYFEAKPGGSLRISIELVDSGDHPLNGASVSYSWLGTIGTLQDMNNGTYQGVITMPTSEGLQSISISVYLDENHTVATSSLSILVKQPQLSNEAIITNTIVAAIILAVFFILFFVLYLRPKIIKRRLVRFEDVKSCTVHKGPIKEGLTYVCPTCGSIYCTKCAQALFNNNDACWSCATPIQPFAVSYQEDWRKNLQYVLIYQGGSPEPIYEQSLTTEDIMMPEMLKILKKSINRHVSKPSKKSSTIDVQEYFNSKILFGRGEFITLVLVSRIDSSFIHDKMVEFVDNWEMGFYDKDTGTWKVDTRSKFATKTRFMIDGMFVKEEEIKEEPRKGKGKGEYVDPESLIHKAPKPGADIQSEHLPDHSVKASPAQSRDDGDQVTTIPVKYPERKEEQNSEPPITAEEIQAAIKAFLSQPPAAENKDADREAPKPRSSSPETDHAKPGSASKPDSEDDNARKNDASDHASTSNGEDGRPDSQ